MNSKPTFGITRRSCRTNTINTTEAINTEFETIWSQLNSFHTIKTNSTRTLHVPERLTLFHSTRGIRPTGRMFWGSLWCPSTLPRKHQDITCLKTGHDRFKLHYFQFIVLTNFIETSPSPEAASRSATQELLSILWNPKVPHRVHNSHPLVKMSLCLTD
jgi:hypothetical protein